MPNQYNVRDLTNVPAGTQFTGYNPVGTSGVASFNSYVAGLRADGAKMFSITDSVFPNATGSYNSGEYFPIGGLVPSSPPSVVDPLASGIYQAGSGTTVYSSVKIVEAVGTAIRETDYPGFMDLGPLNASGITHRLRANPTDLNRDPFLQSNV